MDEDTKKKIIAHYQKGQGSIQDIARVYKVEVSEVLDVVGATDLKSVYIGGDTIDEKEAGQPINYGKTEQIRYTTN